MDERLWLSEEECRSRWGNPIFRLGGYWEYSEIYYDTEADGFMELRLREEYLDTGTVSEGCYALPDDQLWSRLVELNHEDGMRAYLNIRGTAPEGFDLSKLLPKPEETASCDRELPHTPKTV